MIKIFLPISVLFISIFFTSTVLAAKLDVSNNSDFGGDVKEFSGGETVYVRVESDSSGDKQKVLNLRKNDYTLLKTYTLSRSSDKFTTSFPAPVESGYYSLEARVESEGSSTVSVKTIKVGNVNGANIKVDVKSESSQQLEKSTTSNTQSSQNYQEDDEEVEYYGNQSSHMNKRIESEKVTSKNPWQGFVAGIKNLIGLVWMF